MRERICILATAAYFVGLCAYLAVHNMMWIDEFLAWNLISDPSFTHMLQSWYKGADSGGLLFYLLMRPIAAATHAPTAVRCVTAACFALSGVFTYLLLRRRFCRGAAALGSILFWLGSPLVLSLSVEVRFYGMLMLAFCGVAYGTDRLIEAETSVLRIAALAFLMHAVMLSSHMLGLIYSAVIIFALLLVNRSRATMAYTVGSLLSWLLLLIYLPAVRAGADKLNWIQAPRLIDFFRYFLHEPFGIHAVNVLLYMIIAAAMIYRLRDVTRYGGAVDFVEVLSVLMLLMPGLFAIVSHLYKPIVADRYLVPWIFGLAFFVASFLSKLLSRMSSQPRAGLVVAGLIAILLLHLNAISLFWKRPQQALEAIKNLPGDLPIAIPDDDVFEQLEFYDARHKERYVFLMPQRFRDQASRNIFAAVAVQGYGGNIQALDAYSKKHPAFLYARFQHDHGGYQTLIASDPSLVEQSLFSVQVGKETVPILLVQKQ